MSLKKICLALAKYNNFLITSHVSPEGDAIGSQLGFYSLIQKLGKKGVIVSDDKIPYGYDFLPGNKSILRFDKKAKAINFDCLVVLDCADLNRTGQVYKLNTRNLPVLNIDHHISNRYFGTVNWVDPCASSCSEMIYKLAKKLRLTLDADAALSLYTGLMTDTGSFRYSNTTSFTHQAVAQLLKSGIDVAQVYRYTYENIPPQDVKLLLKLLGKIEFFAKNQIAAFQINKKLLENKKPIIDLADFALSFGRAIQGVEVVVLFKENVNLPGEVRINLRSQGRVDVNKIATSFGGGGHKTAAGCTLHGGFIQIKKKIITKIIQAL